MRLGTIWNFYGSVAVLAIGHTAVLPAYLLQYITTLQWICYASFSLRSIAIHVLRGLCLQSAIIYLSRKHA